MAEDLTTAPTNEGVPQQPQNIQPVEVPSPKDKPANCPQIYSLPTEEFNRTLQETFAYFKHKRVRIPDGRIGEAIGVDPRPMKGVPTRQGQDGNYLCVHVAKLHALPGRTPWENLYFMPEDLTLVEQPPTKEKDIRS